MLKDWYAFNRQEIKARVPETEGMYWIGLRSEERIIYIGISHIGQNIQTRLLKHLLPEKNLKLQNYVNTRKEDLVFNFKIAGKEHLLQPGPAEDIQIYLLQPECNTQGKDRLPGSVDALIDSVQGRFNKKV